MLLSPLYLKKEKVQREQRELATRGQGGVGGGEWLPQLLRWQI